MTNEEKVNTIYDMCVMACDRDKLEDIGYIQCLIDSIMIVISAKPINEEVEE